VRGFVVIIVVVGFFLLGVIFGFGFGRVFVPGYFFVGSGG
jgi:hypothetical protein